VRTIVVINHKLIQKSLFSRLIKDDIEDYLLRQKMDISKVPASPVSSEDNLPIGPRSPLPPPPPISSSARPAAKREMGFSKDDVTVINTLRLMSAIENLLDDLGIQIIQVSFIQVLNYLLSFCFLNFSFNGNEIRVVQSQGQSKLIKINT
jgi:hypothetical protein